MASHLPSAPRMQVMEQQQAQSLQQDLMAERLSDLI
jgi:hypothetical protein